MAIEADEKRVVVFCSSSLCSGLWGVHPDPFFPMYIASSSIKYRGEAVAPRLMLMIAQEWKGLRAWKPEKRSSIGLSESLVVFHESLHDKICRIPVTGEAGSNKTLQAAFENAYPQLLTFLFFDKAGDSEAVHSDQIRHLLRGVTFQCSPAQNSVDLLTQSPKNSERTGVFIMIAGSLPVALYVVSSP